MQLWAVSQVFALPPPSWDFDAFVPGSGKFLVLIDTNPLEDDEAVFQVDVEVNFLTENDTLLSTKKIKLLQSRQTLRKGTIYQFDVDNDVDKAQKIKAGNVVFTLQNVGGKSIADNVQSDLYATAAGHTYCLTA